MTTDIRTAALAKAEKVFPVYREKDLSSAMRESDIAHFVAGAVWAAARVTPTREQVEGVIAANVETIDHCGYGMWVVEDEGALADAVLKLITELAESGGAVSAE